MPFQSLLSANVYRDGGSIEAVFRTVGGSIEAICLKANILALDGIGKRYSDAYWFRNESDPHRPFIDSLKAGPLVEPGSDTEKTLLAELKSFLQNPVVEELPDAGDKTERLEVVRDLLINLPIREHFDPALHREVIRQWEDRVFRRSSTR